MAEVIPLSLNVAKNSYLSLNGPDIEAIGANGVISVPEGYAANRVKRDGDQGGFHCTFINHGEIKQLLPAVGKKERYKHLKELRENLYKKFGDPQSWELPVDLGLGKVTQQGAVSFFRVLHWPQGQRMRHSLGLTRTSFHVTLGFDPHDVHVGKGPLTLLALDKHTSCTPSDLERIISVLGYYADDKDFVHALFWKCLYSNNWALMRSMFVQSVYTANSRLILHASWFLLKAVWHRCYKAND